MISNLTVGVEKLWFFMFHAFILEAQNWHLF